MNIQQIKEQICDVCHKMWQQGWVAANDGNITVKLEDGTFLATPTGISKSFITPEKLVRINSQGDVLDGVEGYKPSSEIKMHLRCYTGTIRYRGGCARASRNSNGLCGCRKKHEWLFYDWKCYCIRFGSADAYGTSTDEVPEAIAPYLQSMMCFYFKIMAHLQ